MDEVKANEYLTEWAQIADEDSTDRGIGPVCYKKFFAGVYGDA